MTAFLKVLRKDLLRSIRSPMRIIVFLLFPIVFALLIGLTFGRGGSGGLAPIRVALVDDDGGILGRLLASSLGQTGMPISFETRQAAYPEAIRMVENDKVSAVLRIPEGFTDSLLAGVPTHLEIVKNPAEAVYPTIVEDFSAVLALLGSTLFRLLGEPIREIREGTDTSGGLQTDALLARVSVAIGRRMQAVSRYAFPPAIYLDHGEGEGGEEGSQGRASAMTIALYVLPGMATFALLMLAIASMADLRREEMTGTLARQFVAPIPAWSAVLGKVGATFLLSLGFIIVLSLVAALQADGRVSLPGFVSLSVAFACTTTGFATLIPVLFRSERAGTAFASILVMVMAMLGGSFIPLETFPDSIRSLAPLTLNYWAIDGYRKLLFDAAAPSDLLVNLAILLGLGVAFLMVSLPLVRRRFLRGV